MKKVFELIIQVFRFHKLKILLIFASSILFLAILFPFSDLTDLITAKVLEGTNNQVLFQADKLDLGLIPPVSVTGENVSVDVGMYPTIEAKKITVTPSLFSLIGLAAGSAPTSINATVNAEGLMGGNVSISHAPDGSNDEGAKKNRLIVQADNVQLGDVQSFLDLPISMQGKATLNTNLVFYPNFDGQPEGEIQLTSKGIKIPPGTIPTQFGPVPMPGVSWSQLLLKAHMGTSNLYLDDVAFGSAKDPMSGRVKGQMNVRVDKGGPVLGAYDVKVELIVAASAEKDLDTLLILLKDFRQATAQGGKYVFRVTAQAAGAQPNLGRLQSF
jgi:type II secretion system protein N